MVLLAIEGLDGSGKATQTALLQARAQAQGLRVATLAFPRYGASAYAAAIAEYLNGAFGPLASVDPHFAAVLYAMDRYAARDHLLDLIANHDLVILDRYVSSNLAYQGARVAPEARARFITWLSALEYGNLRLPAADLTLYLAMPVTAAAELVARKQRRDYTDRKADLHEADTRYLAACQAVYTELLAAQHHSVWHDVPGADSAGQPLSPEALREHLWAIVAPRFGKGDAA
jgi:dTMP kinase